MKAKDIIKILDEWAPIELAEDWDNVGFQIGRHDREVETIVLALDLDHRVLKKAKEMDAQMIITHHPFIFSGVRSINDKSYDGLLIMDMIKSDIVAYNAHTNLDQTIDGVNEELGKILELKNSQHIKTTSETAYYGYGRVGDIDEVSMADYIPILKKKLDLEHLIIYGDINRNINRIAVMGGSGSDFIADARDKGADLFITGDIKYHDAQEAEKLGILLADAGHYHTEKIILPVIKKKLEERLDGLNIIIYDKSSPLYGIY